MTEPGTSATLWLPEPEREAMADIEAASFGPGDRHNRFLRAATPYLGQGYFVGVLCCLRVRGSAHEEIRAFFTAAPLHPGATLAILDDVAGIGVVLVHGAGVVAEWSR